MRKIWLILLIFILTGCENPIEKTIIEPFKYKSILSIVNNDLYAEIEEYTIYGKYFNLKGNINYIDDFSQFDLVLKNKEEELVYKLFYEINNNKIFFKTSEYINEGINLEKINVSNYVILLRIIKDGKINYYNLINKSDYSYVDYYTITKNNKNNYINITFSSYQNNSFFKMEMKENVRKKNICDIVIDPGHGGGDSGATNDNYLEKDFNLEYANMLKVVLEELGLKVKMTRYSDMLPSFYGSNSRTGIPYECKAKLMLSIHLNSSNSYIGDGGFELYMANGSSSKYPKIMALNIVNYANTNYSPNNYNKVDDGVYIRTYSEKDIEGVLNDSIKGNWTMYENLNTDTTYYYFIRETGGIVTNAITDGRNKEYPGNPYYNSNHGTEAYLLELGYISSAKNLEKLINEKEGYIKGIVEGIKFYINN